MTVRFKWILLGIVMGIVQTSGHVFAGGVVGSGTPASCTEAALTTALAGGGTITFNCGAQPTTITVTSPKEITLPTIINGGGTITLSGGGTTYIFYNHSSLLSLLNLTLANGRFNMPKSVIGKTVVDGGGAIRGAFQANLAVDNCIFVNNVVTSQITNPTLMYDTGGGAIFVHTGKLRITHSQFISNQSLKSSGGAIHTLRGDVVITDSLFQDNQATSFGGAFYSDGVPVNSAIKLRFTRVKFINNTAVGEGGGMYNYLYQSDAGSGVVIDSSQFIGNTVTTNSLGAAYGGGLRVGNGTLVITDTTFAANNATKQGGAVWSGQATSTSITNVTLSGNNAAEYGGALMIASSGAYVITNVTLADNNAGIYGGAIYGGGANVTLQNTILGLHTAGNPYGLRIVCDKEYTNGGNNIQAIANGGSTQCASGILIADPLISQLTDNGGSTPTIALLKGSPAIDAGSNATCPQTDQRGRFRTFDGNWDGAGICDIGAFEYTSFDNFSTNAPIVYRNRFSTTTAALNWNSKITWAAAWDVQVDNNPDFSSPVFVQNSLTVPKVTLTLPQEGVYYWRVRAKRADGFAGNWSAPDSFIVQFP